ncbi:TetR/AcrR family transcriptional regulator [Herbiconiux sp. 11R-BC]|uniref:TetR/AcrR family transcriptional regulator n=1 Tax=Herbiconiux sp. 11R-BC TaxID=3111637 RepID=UPI003C0AD7F2
MASDARTKMVDGAALLLAKRGLHATSFSEVLELTGAPRGSVYHHFPGGKQQLVDAALDAAGKRALDVLDAVAGQSAETVTGYFLELWRSVLERSTFSAGCAVLAVTVATDSPELLTHTAEVFRAWRRKLARLLELGGLSAADAARFSALLVASSEGAVVLSRAEQSFEPFDLVSDELLQQVRSLTASAS